VTTDDGKYEIFPISKFTALQPYHVYIYESLSGRYETIINISAYISANVRVSMDTISIRVSMDTMSLNRFSDGVFGSYGTLETIHFDQGEFSCVFGVVDQAQFNWDIQFAKLLNI
jgi:hypothetical protein